MLFCQNSIYKYFVGLGSFNDCLIWTPLQEPPGLQVKMKTNIPWKNMEVKEKSISSKPVRAVIRKQKKCFVLFPVLTKCPSRFDCLIFEILFIEELNPKLNAQKDSIRTELIIWHYVQMPYSIPYIHILSVSHKVTLVRV